MRQHSHLTILTCSLISCVRTAARHVWLQSPGLVITTQKHVHEADCGVRVPLLQVARQAVPRSIQSRHVSHTDARTQEFPGKDISSRTSSARFGALAAVGGLPVRGGRSRGGQQRLAVRRGRALVGDSAHGLGQPLHALLLRRLRSERRSTGLVLHHQALESERRHLPPAAPHAPAAASPAYSKALVGILSSQRAVLSWTARAVIASQCIACGAHVISYPPGDDSVMTK